jgi:hypothetical protein
MSLEPRPLEVFLDLSSPHSAFVKARDDGTGGLPADDQRAQEVAIMLIDAEMLDAALQLSASEAAAKEAVVAPSPTKKADNLDLQQEKQYQASNAEDPGSMQLAMQAAAAEMEAQREKMAKEQHDDDLYHTLNSMEHIMGAREQHKKDR